MRLGIIARMDNTGLGNQTRELVKMLNPDKVLVINSYPFNKNEQHPEWYENYNTTFNDGFLSDSVINKFLEDIDVVLSCEIFYSDTFVQIAKDKNIKTILQYNYEFLDYFNNPNLPLPDYLLAPSVWNLDKVVEAFGNRCKIVYLPPPIDHTQFQKNKIVNAKKQYNRVLHITGRQAYLDRNGSNFVSEMLKYSEGNYDVIVKSQYPVNIELNNPRLKLDVSDVVNMADLYNEFDAVVMPRKYGGLCLPMNEALLSGLPVFMTDISPNNSILPKEWLAESIHTGGFYAKAYLDYYDVSPRDLAYKLDQYMAINDKTALKEKAFEIGYNNFSAEQLLTKYLNIINE